MDNIEIVITARERDLGGFSVRHDDKEYIPLPDETVDANPKGTIM